MIWVNSLSDEQLYAAAYLYSYHFINEQQVATEYITDSFWGDEDAQSLMLRHTFEHHALLLFHPVSKRL